MGVDVVVSTCIGAGASTLRDFVSEESQYRFNTVLVDEAAQCMEPALLPACVHGCERLILIGDQNQLPPVVASAEALEHGLGYSLTHGLTHSPTGLLTHLLTGLLTHSLTYLLTHSLTHLLTHLLIYLLT